MKNTIELKPCPHCGGECDQNGWISVEDELPEIKDDSVIAYFDNESIETVHIEDNFKDITNGFDDNGKQIYTKWYISAGITHWMPLPHSPKGS